MLERLFPKQFDDQFPGKRPALWLLGFLIALKLVMSVNSIFNTASVASGADGIPDRKLWRRSPLAKCSRCSR